MGCLAPEVDIIEYGRVILENWRIIRETPTMWVIESPSKHSESRFRKKDLAMFPQCVAPRFLRAKAA